ncbi:hypothetical protein ACIQXA_33545 [Streptomyces massasporeus]|uniref:hypothetical protein n=1 Tax=Streptomyces massasporeus TaxID=67324 RepID=UPI003800AA3D
MTDRQKSRPHEHPAASARERVDVARRIPDGTAYRIVKVAYEPAELERRLRELGWDITVTSTAGPFFWGAGGDGNTPCTRSGSVGHPPSEPLTGSDAQAPSPW